jgi:hypothetical protein
MPFATTTIGKIYSVCKLDASDETLRGLVESKLSDIERISPDVVASIEALISLIESRSAALKPNERYLVAAETAKWLGGAGLSAESSIDDLKSGLIQLTGLYSIVSSSSGQSNGAAFRRQDQLIPLSWSQRWGYRNGFRF